MSGAHRRARGEARLAGRKEDIPFVRRLEREMEAWVADGQIAPAQRDAILSRYRALAEADERAGPGRLVTVVSILGAILVGAGILLFVASNWSAIPAWGKLALIFSAMGASYGTGFVLRFEPGTYPKVGAALILLGAIVFGAGIFLVAQIYHLNAHYPNGPLLWAVGVLPLAYLLGFRSLLSLAVLDLFVWFGLELGTRLAGPEVAPRPALPVALFLTAGVLAWGIGLAHRGAGRVKGLAAPWVVAGVAVTCLAGYLLTFQGVLACGALRPGRAMPPEIVPFLVALPALFLAAAVARLLPKEREKGHAAELSALALVMGAGLLMALGRLQAGPGDVALPVAVNLVYFAAIVGVIALGYVRRSASYVNLGLLFFVLDVVARYVDFFWKLLPRSLFFIGGGLILIAGGVWLEKKRRRVLGAFLEEGAAR